MQCPIEIVEQGFYVEQMTDPRVIERAGRVCYKSEGKFTPTSAPPFIKGLIKRKHESVLEHGMATVRFITDRGVSHELVRHRICSPSQESTRYVKYGDKPMQFIRPVWLPDLACGIYGGDYLVKSTAENLFISACLNDAHYYEQLLSLCNWKPEQARQILPNALKTEVVVTANYRQWRHILSLRAVGTTGRPHPQMKALMDPLLDFFIQEIPYLFEDLRG